MLTSISPPVSGGRGRGCVWTDAIFHHILIMSLLSVLRLTIPHPPRPPPPLSSGNAIAIRANTSNRVREIVYGLVFKICVCVCACVSNIWAGYGRVDKRNQHTIKSSMKIQHIACILDR